MQAARGAPLSDRPHPLRRFAALFLVAAGVLAVDALTKTLAVAHLEGQPPVPVIDGVLELRLVRNPGAAFGLAQGMTVLLTCIAVGVIAMILRAARRLRSTAWSLALGLVLGGAFGNLADRLFREPGPLRGHVIDFLELPRWPVFNVADSAIMTGATLMVWLTVRGVPLDPTSSSRTPARG